MLLKSKAGETKSKAEWEQELNTFWEWVEKQNRYICNVRAKSNRRGFVRPADAFERYARILELEAVPASSSSYKGVF